ncbi:hypothetical protein ACLB2K_074337 [Fragaria x ananassa]
MESTRVCVTGSSSYLGSWLVKSLREKGYASKVRLRKGLVPNGEHNRLRLFEADIYSPFQFEPAIQGCKYVFHLATPLQHDPKNTQFKDTSEAAVSGLMSIVESCIKSGTVKRLIYTASVVAASPIKDSGNGFKEVLDESCWTPFNLSFLHANEGFLITLSEKELLRLNENGDLELEVVSITCGLVGGDTLLPTLAESVGVLTSQVTNNKARYQVLRFLEELLGKVPIVHIKDVCEAHILCMEKPSITGRFLCATAYLSSAEVASHWKKYHPEINIGEGLVLFVNKN